MTAPDDFDAFCRREYPKLVGTLDLYLGDPHVAEELVQEALIRAAQRWERVSRLDSPGGWTYRVAVNLARSWFRRRRARRRVEQRLASEPLLVHEDEDVADRRAVRAAVRELPARQRLALVQRYYLGLPATEVAVRMGISHDAVRALTKRAVAKLRTQLGPDTLDHEEAHDVV